MSYVSAAVTDKALIRQDSNPDAKGNGIAGLNQSHFTLIDPYLRNGSIYDNCLIISDFEIALYTFLCSFLYHQNRGQPIANALSVKSDLFCSNLIHENIKKSFITPSLSRPIKLCL